MMIRFVDAEGKTLCEMDPGFVPRRGEIVFLSFGTLYSDNPKTFAGEVVHIIHDYHKGQIDVQLKGEWLDSIDAGLREMGIE